MSEPERDAEIIEFAKHQSADESLDTDETHVIEGELIDDGQFPDSSVNAELAEHHRRIDERAGAKRPLLAAWIKDRAELAYTLKWYAGWAGHVTAYHALRLPLYASRLVGRAPRGAGRVVHGLGRWVMDLRTIDMMQLPGADAATTLKMHRQRDQHLPYRRGVLAALLTAALTVALWLTFGAPSWFGWLVCCAAVATLGVLGGQRDKPLASAAVVPSQYERLSADVVIRALGALGISEVNKALGKNGDGIMFHSDIQRDGKGYRADVNLPYGVTAETIRGKRPELASGLRRPLGCVWPEGDPEAHAGRLVLWCGDQDMRKQHQPAWPLDKRAADVFAPIPLGTDPRGQTVSVTLAYANLLVGAIPRQGKTATLRLVLLAAALDTICELRVFELKGTGDLAPLEQCAHRYASGSGEPAIEATMASLRELYAEMETRAARIRELARKHPDLVADNKVTRQIAAQRRLQLWPIVCAIDECQELYTSPDCAAEAERLSTAIIKRGPAMGIMLLLATQRPDKESLPTPISANAALRFCLYVTGWRENDMVLGTSKHQQGVRATELTPILDAGIGMLVGHGPEASVVRTFYKNTPQAWKIAKRARAAREQAGTVTGHAMGQDAEAAPRRSVLDDVATVFAGHDKMASRAVLAQLEERWPEVYDGWTEQTLAAALKPLDVTPGQVWTVGADGAGCNRKGYTIEAIRAALSARDERGRPPDSGPDWGSAECGS